MTTTTKTTTIALLLALLASSLPLASPASAAAASSSLAVSSSLSWRQPWPLVDTVRSEREGGDAAAPSSVPVTPHRWRTSAETVRYTRAPLLLPPSSPPPSSLLILAIRGGGGGGGGGGNDRPAAPAVADTRPRMQTRRDDSVEGKRRSKTRERRGSRSTAEINQEKKEEDDEDENEEEHLAGRDADALRHFERARRRFGGYVDPYQEEYYAPSPPSSLLSDGEREYERMYERDYRGDGGGGGCGCGEHEDSTSDADGDGRGEGRADGEAGSGGEGEGEMRDEVPSRRAAREVDGDEDGDGDGDRDEGSLGANNDYDIENESNNGLLRIRCSLVVVTDPSAFRRRRGSSSISQAYSGTARSAGTSLLTYVDTGAQVTVLSSSAARRSGLLHLLDVRYEGRATGVGDARILGRIPAGSCAFVLEVEEEEEESPPPGGEGSGSAKKNSLLSLLSPQLTVLDDSELCTRGVDLLLGLDVLDEWGASICLREGTLRVAMAARKACSSRRHGGGGGTEREEEEEEEVVIPFVGRKRGHRHHPRNHGDRPGGFRDCTDRRKCSRGEGGQSKKRRRGPGTDPEADCIS